MSFSLLENVLGDACYLNGERVPFASALGESLRGLQASPVFYESIRVDQGIMLFYEDHMLRLLSSIEKHNEIHGTIFPIPDVENLYATAMCLIEDDGDPIREGNLRVVVTEENRLIYRSDMKTPSSTNYRDGIAASTITWERIQPQIKALRADYKASIAEALCRETPFGAPYEILLQNTHAQITEGSRSNVLILLNGCVYSPPDALILIGITRKYVKKAVADAGFRFAERMFTLEELLLLKKDGQNPIVFLTSSPFDILPVRTIDDSAFWETEAGDLSELYKIREAYFKIREAYIHFHDVRLPD